MAVMTSPALDNPPLDLKAAAYPPADAMVIDPKPNGVHDVLLDAPEATVSPAQDPVDVKPSTNGTHTTSDVTPAVAPAIQPTTNVSSGIDGVAQFLPDTHDEKPTTIADADIGAVTSAGHAVEAPTSDVRDEPAPIAEPATESAPTQLTSSTEDTKPRTVATPPTEAMDTTPDIQPPSQPTDTSAPPTNSMTELTIETNNAPAPTCLTQSPPPIDREMEDVPSSGKVRPREDDEMEDDDRDAKRTKTEDESSLAEFKIPVVPTHSEPSSANGVAATPSTPATETAPVESSGVQKAVDLMEWPTTPMTDAQTRFLLERLRNTKKIKNAAAFKDPVDHVALNLPTYPDIVKNPMDLSTMETRLKEKQYDLVVDFMTDLDLMIENSELFNNKQHPVTQAAYNIRAYFLKGIKALPKAGAEEPPKQKIKKPVVNTSTKPRRESRVIPPTVKSPVASTPTSASAQTTWPLNHDGTPYIRRDSSSANDRPKREIHRPSKDLPYTGAKPRKKKYAQELKFCESVLAEILKAKYASISYPFTTPVDPVALNIPSYLKIIKKPMDFGTIEKNLKNGVYQSSKDFHADASLVFANCYKFNPQGDAVNKMGHQLEAVFESLWKEKSDWLAQHAPASEQSPDVYSDEEDDEEEEEEDVDPAQAQFLAIQQQIAALNETAQQLLQQQKGGKRASPKASGKKKKTAPKRKPSLPLNVPPPAKSSKQKRAKAPAPLSFAQKQEISEGISTLGDVDMRRAVQIIRNGCPHLANVHDDEMELDMDEINDETLRELFKFIKSLRGPKGGVVPDDDFEPPRQVSTQGAGRPKKNKPMGKTEQEDNMRKIQEKLQSFQGGASGSSQSPPAHDASSDDDDETSGSESEEE